MDWKREYVVCLSSSSWIAGCSELPLGWLHGQYVLSITYLHLFPIALQKFFLFISQSLPLTMEAENVTYFLNLNSASNIGRILVYGPRRNLIK